MAAKKMPRAGRAPKTPGHMRPPRTPGALTAATAQANADQAQPHHNQTGGTAPTPQGSPGS